MRLYLKSLILILCALTSPLAARATATPAISITPGYTTIGVSTSLQYSATVTGLANTAIKWEVNGIVGGNATIGTISTTGLYKAPATVPSAEILIEAVASNNTTVAAVYIVIQPVGPPITSITPNPIPVGTYTITVKGSGFLSGASVRNNGTILATTFVNSTTLTAVGYQGTNTPGSFQVMNPNTLLGSAMTAAFGATVSPASANVTLGATQQFTSTGATSWTATAGTISSSGLYTAPAKMPSSSAVTISAKGAGGTATAVVTLIAPAQTISPATASVTLGQTQQFTSTGATGWTATAGTITSSGLYTAPATMPSSYAVTVTATGPSGSAKATVTLVAPPQSISPATVSLRLGGTQQFTSTGATSWNVSAGSVSASGLYTAPATMPSSNSVTVRATGAGGTATAVITLTAAQSIAPTAASVTLGATQQFTSAGATSWTATAGTVSANGLYTAPATMPSSSTVIVTASGPNGSASASVTLSAASGSISPANVTLKLSQTQQFTCAGGSIWMASAGSINSNGLYTAPSTMPASSVVTITVVGGFGFTTATVNLVNTGAQTISPAVATVAVGASVQFASAGATSWSATAGTVSSTGLYTAPATLPSNTAVIVTATGPNGSASAAVTLISANNHTITPTAATVALGQSQQFSSDNTTSWTASAGTISSTGLFTAPATMPASPAVSVTATGPSGSATANITLVAQAAMTISPLSISINLGQAQQFTANGATSWTASAGTITSTGLFTAPATMPLLSTVTITASGPNGSATAIALLITISVPGGPISVSAQAPPYGWELIPGATRRIHASVTNGTTNEVTWTYTTTGGATATLTPAPSPNILGAFVDVTLGSVGGACTNVGTTTAPVFSSPASVTLTATSVDDKTKSVSIPIQVCSPTVQAFVSPFNVRLYSGQKVDLQSWVWGTVNDNVTWTVSQPSGGNGAFIAPPAGGSATTARDALFSATVAGDYTVTATSVANPSVSASAIVSVDSAAMPSYAVTPNHTEPVDCSVDPSQAGKSYDVGLGHTYASLAAAYVAIGSNILNPGTTIRLFNTDTTGINPTHYHEYLRLDGQGTEAAPIRIVGCADSQGNLPVMDAANATSYSPTDNSVAASISGMYQIGFHHSNGFAVYPTITSPSYIVIEGIAFRNAYPTSTSGAANYYYAPGSSTPTQWGTAASCIRPYEGNHVTVRGNDMEDCSFGILADFNGNNGWGGFFGDFDLQGNYFTNIGATNASEHMAYVQGFRQVIQGNYFDQLKSVSSAGELKMRGVAEVVRYNHFNTSTNTRTIDFVEEQDSNMYMSFLGYYYTPPGSESFATEYPKDGYTPDMIAAADEAWHKAYAYGNIINFGPSTPSSQAPIHFFGDQGQYSDPNTNPPTRAGDLFDYNNTIYSVGSNSLHLVDTMQNQDNQIRWEWPTLTLWNNAMYVGTLNNTGAQGFQMSTLRSDIYNLGPNWLSGNWGNNTLTCSNNAANVACVGTGWPYQMETTQYMDGGNLPAHVNGLSNLITGGSTVPFDTTTWVPTTGGGLVGSGAALPASISNMPVRLQLSGYTLQLRTSPLTLGAHD